MAKELCAVCLQSFDQYQLLEHKGQRLCPICRQRHVFPREAVEAGGYEDPYAGNPAPSDAEVVAGEVGAEAVNRYVAPYLGSIIKEYADTKTKLPGDRLWRRFLLIIIVVFVGSLVAYYGTKYGYRALKRAAFSGEIASYLEVAANPQAVLAAAPASKLNTHCIVINQDTQAVDDLFYELPWKARASDVEDAGLVVVLKWDAEKAGDYYDLHDKTKKIGTGFRHTCVVTVIDWAQRQIVEKALIRGQAPFELKLGRADAYGSKPTERIVNFVCSFIAY